MASGDVTTGGSSTTPNSALVGKTSDMLLKGLGKAYKGGVDVYGKPLYTDPSATTQSAWGQGSSFANNLIGSGGYGSGQRSAQDSLGGVFSGYGNAGAQSNSQLGQVFGGYGQLGDNNGLTSGQGAAMNGNAGLGGHVQVVAYDATAEAIELMGKGVVSLVLAQKPFDMGYMAVQFAVADAAGVTSLPRRVETGFAIIDKDNVGDPNFSRFIYKVGN